MIGCCCRPNYGIEQFNSITSSDPTTLHYLYSVSQRHQIRRNQIVHREIYFILYLGIIVVTDELYLFLFAGNIFRTEGISDTSLGRLPNYYYYRQIVSNAISSPRPRQEVPVLPYVVHYCPFLLFRRRPQLLNAVHYIIRPLKTGQRALSGKFHCIMERKRQTWIQA